VEFVKFSALGNCFVVIAVTRHPRGARRAEARIICDRVSGVAADGVAYVHAPTRRLHLYNADGTRARLSGNGARCAAAWWFSGPGRRAGQVTFRTDAGGVRCARQAGGAIAVTLPPPDFAARAVPARWPRAEMWGARLAKVGLLSRVRVFALSAGNPQVVLWGRDIPRTWRALSAAIQEHPAFPDSTNVVFACRRGRVVEARLFERGVGETPSSGTGAAAAVVAGAREGYCGRHSTVTMPGGKMDVNWMDSGAIELTCTVREIARGELRPAARRRA
jgi:diaminopimelate epimerase